VLLLFDIDGTLLSTSGAGTRAFTRAGRDWFGPDFSTEGISFAGRLDPLIIADVLRQRGLPANAENTARFRTEYCSHLPAELERSRESARALPGVVALLDALQAKAPPHVAIGLLTGNYPETGTLKLDLCGIPARRFSIHVWGDESPSDPPTRDDLPRVGMDKYTRQHGRQLKGEEVVVIGDTPFDVRCAQAHGCRSLAVATGHHSVQQLKDAGADRAEADLSNTAQMVAWLLGTAAV